MSDEVRFTKPTTEQSLESAREWIDELKQQLAQANARITALTAERVRLRAALAPFAALAPEFTLKPNTQDHHDAYAINDKRVTYGDFRRAAEALAPERAGEGE